MYIERVIKWKVFMILLYKNNGESYKLEQYKGDVMLIVNTASECGFTPQFEGLQKLYDEYKDQRFIILDFHVTNLAVKNQDREKKLLKIAKLTMV